MVKKENYARRFERHHDELRWLYMELYDNGDMFAELCDNMQRFYQERSSRRWIRSVRRIRTGIGVMICWE